MDHILVALHIIGACVALVAGLAAVMLQHRTLAHRVAGVIYLVCWVAVFSSGIMIGVLRQRVSVFQFFNFFGMFFVVRAYWAVLKRKQLGRIWLKRHYSAMLSSLAAIVVATANQVLMRAVGSYPIWVFFVMCASPSLFLPWYGRVLDRRYGFAKIKSVKPELSEGGLLSD